MRLLLSYKAIVKLLFMPTVRKFGQLSLTFSDNWYISEV
jgi:hypothetical protein